MSSAAAERSAVQDVWSDTELNGRCRVNRRTAAVIGDLALARKNEIAVASAREAQLIAA